MVSLIKQFFVEWANLVFGPGVKKYLQGNNLPLETCLVVDNVPADPHNLQNCWSCIKIWSQL